MTWPEIRNLYPQQWLLIEAIEARTEDGDRLLEGIIVVDHFTDAVHAWEDLTSLKQQAPRRELYVLHTSRDQPNIRDTGRVRLGSR